MEQKELNEFNCPKCKNICGPDTDDCKHFYCYRCKYGYSSNGIWDQSKYKDPLPYIKLPKDYKIPKPSEERLKQLEERIKSFQKKNKL